MLWKVLIVGMGNVLMADDGLGVWALYELDRKYRHRDGVCLLEVGTSILSYIAEIGKAENLIAIDAITAGNHPGTIYRISFDYTDTADYQYFARNCHGASLHEAMALSRELTGLPSKAFIYGIEPLAIKEGFYISQVVKTSLNRLLDVVQRDVDAILRKE